MSGKELKCATSPKGEKKNQANREKLQKRIAKAQQLRYDGRSLQ